MLVLVYRKGGWAAVMNIQDVFINALAGTTIAFLGSVVISIVRAPALLDEDLKRANETIRGELLAIQKRERPAITIRRVWVDERAFESSPNSSFSSLNVLLANDAIGLSEDCTARSVIATIRFFDGGGELLCQVDAGRWGDADQPGDPRNSRVPLRRVDFPIGETRELNVAIKFVSDGRCYGIDNDYIATAGRKQSLQITGEPVTAKITLLAVGVNSEFVIRFENPARGELRLLSGGSGTGNGLSMKGTFE